MSFGERRTRLKLDVEGQGGGRILDVVGEGGLGSLQNWTIFMDFICVLSLKPFVLCAKFHKNWSTFQFGVQICNFGLR